MAPDTTRWPQAGTGWEQTFGRLDEKGRDNAVVDDMLGLVDIVNKQVEGLNALLQSTLDEGPIAGFHNARDDIEREDALRPGRAARRARAGDDEAGIDSREHLARTRRRSRRTRRRAPIQKHPSSRARRLRSGAARAG